MIRESFMTDIFISYSRKDIAFARLLYESLNQSDLETWIDWADIPVGENWLDEIYANIEQSNVFMFIISKNSVSSDVCRKEIEHAEKNRKRIIPVIVDDTSTAVVREFVPKLADINWLVFREGDTFVMRETDSDGRHSALPKEPQYQEAIAKLSEAIHTNWDWVRADTRLQNRALEWERHDKNRSYLLRGADLRQAEEDLAKADLDPQPTQGQRDYVLASRQAETRQQRRTLTAVGVGLIITLLAAVIAIIASIYAGKQTQKAEQQADMAFSRLLITQAEDAPFDLAVLLSQEAIRIYDSPENRSSFQAILEENASIIRYFRGKKSSGVYSVAISPDGKFLAFGSNDGLIFLYDLNDYAFMGTLNDGSGKTVNCVAFSPDGRILASGGEYSIIFWDVNTLQPRSVPLMKHLAPIYSVAFSHDGKTLASGSLDNTIILWDVAAYKQIGTPFVGHTSAVLSVAFSPDGKTLASGSYDNTIILWDIDTHEKLGDPLLGHTNVVWSVAFSPDGKTLVSGSSDASIILWNQ
ncbi:MAG: toll/interleukin-1 receptor domain-containing protein [Bacteroidales bacterium]